VLVDTGGALAGGAPVDPGDAVRLEAKALAVLCEHRDPEVEADHSVAASLAASSLTTSIDEVPGAAPKSELQR